MNLQGRINHLDLIGITFVFLLFGSLFSNLHSQITPPPNPFEKTQTNKQTNKNTNPLENLTPPKTGPIFIMAASVGLNFFVLDKKEVKETLRLKELNNTVSISFNIRSGVILNNHWHPYLNYGYAKREDYQYQDNYFYLNNRVLETRYHHNLLFGLDYSLWNYRDNFNISFGLSAGWLRKKILISLIDDIAVNSYLSREIVLEKNFFVATPGIKLYSRMNENGVLYLGFDYKVMIPTGEHYPELVLGVDINLELTSEEKKRPSAFK